VPKDSYEAAIASIHSIAEKRSSRKLGFRCYPLGRLREVPADSVRATIWRSVFRKAPLGSQSHAGHRASFRPLNTSLLSSQDGQILK
jgi:hypothetical protein